MFCKLTKITVNKHKLFCFDTNKNIVNWGTISMQKSEGEVLHGTIQIK